MRLGPAVSEGVFELSRATSSKCMTEQQQGRHGKRTFKHLPFCDESYIFSAELPFLKYVQLQMHVRGTGQECKTFEASIFIGVKRPTASDIPEACMNSRQATNNGPNRMHDRGKQTGFSSHGKLCDAL